MWKVDKSGAYLIALNMKPELRKLHLGQKYRKIVDPVLKPHAGGLVNNPAPIVVNVFETIIIIF